MANHMSTTLTIENLDEQSFDKLKEIFNDGTNEYYTNVEHIIKQMYGDVEIDSLDWWITNIGSKWLEVETSIRDEFEQDVQLYLTSAWNVPTEFLEKLRDILVEINDKIVISGTYEDESLDPMGAFLYAKDYDDIEDLDIDVDWDEYWDEDDDGEYREDIYEEVLKFKQELYRTYLEILKDREKEE